MGKKLIVMAHGIGDSKPGFENDWIKAVKENIDLSDVDVKGLLWEDVLQQVEDKYPIVSDQLADLVDMCGFPNLKKLVKNDGWKTFKDYMMDVLVYVGLDDMWLKIQDQCALKLDALRKDNAGNEVYKEADTILIGHSLGAAMLPHLVWREFAFTGTIPYRGLILLASPLGFESPLPDLCQDFLQRMGGISGGSRLNTIKRFARTWNMVGDGCLKFIINENDIVCSDVKYEIPVTHQLVDLIPLRQGFNPTEVNLLNQIHKDCVNYVTFGKRDPTQIVNNHDVLTYLKLPVFVDALKALL